MRAIVGIDAQGAYKPALELLGGLSFPDAQVTLLHAADPTMPFVAPAGADADAQAEYTKAIQNRGLAALEDASAVACGMEMSTHRRMAFGPAAQTLIAEAEYAHAELVAVCATHTSKGGAGFLGSVSRALTISSPTSILVAKGHRDLNKPLRAVLATDHSAYADRCIERLLVLNPQGIGEIELVTAYDVDDHEAEVLHKNLPMLGGMVEQYIEEQNIEKSTALTAKLNKAGFKTGFRVVRGGANDAIRTAIQEKGADFLILGAQGHGFLERLMVGSVSLHQVVAEPYAVMVVRA